MNLETVGVYDPMEDFWIIMKIPTAKFPRHTPIFNAATGFQFTFIKLGKNKRMLYEITARPVS